MNREFPALLRRIRDRFATQGALARAIGISNSRVGRALRGEDTLNTLSCLRLAQAAGEKPSTILRAAGKGEIADLLETLYGAETPTVPARHAVRLTRLQSLSATNQRLIDALLEELAVKDAPGPKPHGPRSKSR